MGIFDSVLYRGMKRGKAKYITQTENSIPEYILFLSHAHTYAKIITGEADPKFYEDYRVVETFKRLLLGNMDISFLFHKESPFEAGLEKLMAENDSLCEFKKECPSKLHLYWAPKRPSSLCSCRFNSLSIGIETYAWGKKRRIDRIRQAGGSWGVG